MRALILLAYIGSLQAEERVELRQVRVFPLAGSEALEVGAGKGEPRIYPAYPPPNFTGTECRTNFKEEHFLLARPPETQTKLPAPCAACSP